MRHHFNKKWLTKLLGYDFRVEYKRGRENKVADALSRREETSTEPTLTVISYPTATWLKELTLSYQDDESKELLAKWDQSALDLVKYNYRNYILFYKGRMYVGSTTTLREQLIQHAHDSPVGGHSGYDKTLYRARRDFYWPGMKSKFDNTFENVIPTSR